jgi:TM2 domain-containing membrane protein YozV
MKDKTLAAILAFFLGGLGIHHFYLGNTLKGILYLLFCWTFLPVFLSFIDFIFLIISSNEEFNKKYNPNAANEKPRNYSNHYNSNEFRDKMSEVQYLRNKKTLTNEEKVRLFDLEN